ncbi:STAS domain-containing protein [Streptomyces sp. NPDC003832]
MTLVTVPDKESLAEVSGYTAPFLRKVLADLVSQGRYFLVVDMTHVDFLDSTGLGVLVGCSKRLRLNAGAMALVNPTARMQKVFRITGLHRVFAQFDTVDSAVESLGRQVARAHV